MQATLERAIEIIRTLPIEDYDKIRKVLDEEKIARSVNNEAEINAERAVEVLRTFHDDFYNEEKYGFTQKELKDAIWWILTKYEEQQRNKNTMFLADKTGLTV